jgi:hypothetical protein
MMQPKTRADRQSSAWKQHSDGRFSLQGGSKVHVNAESDRWDPSTWQPIPKYSDENVAQPRTPRNFQVVAQTNAYLHSMQYGQASLPSMSYAHVARLSHSQLKTVGVTHALVGAVCCQHAAYRMVAIAAASCRKHHGSLKVTAMHMMPAVAVASMRAHVSGCRSAAPGRPWSRAPGAGW